MCGGDGNPRRRCPGVARHRAGAVRSPLPPRQTADVRSDRPIYALLLASTARGRTSRSAPTRRLRRDRRLTRVTVGRRAGKRQRPAASSPVTAAVTGCSPRSTAWALRTSRRRPRRTTASSCSGRGSRSRCAAPRPATGRRSVNATLHRTAHRADARRDLRARKRAGRALRRGLRQTWTGRSGAAARGRRLTRGRSSASHPPICRPSGWKFFRMTELSGLDFGE